MFPKKNYDGIRECFGEYEDTLKPGELANLFIWMKERDCLQEEERRSLSGIYRSLMNLASEIKEFIDRYDRGRRDYSNEYQYVLDKIADFEEEKAEEQEERMVPCYVYYLLNEEKDKVKIGISNNPVSRAKSIQTSCGEEIEIINTIKFDSKPDALKAESFLHSVFSAKRKRPSKVAKTTEWFDCDIVSTLMKYFKTRKQIEDLMGREFTIAYGQLYVS